MHVMSIRFNQQRDRIHIRSKIVAPLRPALALPPRRPPNQTAHPGWIPFVSPLQPAPAARSGYEPADSSYPHPTLVSWRFYRGYFPLRHSARSRPLWSSIFAAELGNFVGTFGGQVLRNRWKGAVILGCV